MSVEVASSNHSPFTSGSQDIKDAFNQKYKIDIKKMADLLLYFHARRISYF